MDATATVARGDQTRAILKLLGDEDPAVASLVLQQLELDPAMARARLEQLLAQATGRARHVLLAELERLRVGDPEQALAACCQKIHTVAELEDFVWKMALYQDPKAAIYESRTNLDLWATRVQHHLVEGAGPHEQLAGLRQVLFEEEGLRGNEENYYDPDNSFLDKVIATRLGLPISLTAVYMLVGNRIGISVEPVGLPGHFVARVGPCYFTPYSGAADIPRAKLEETLRESGFNPDFEVLDRTPLPLMAQRMVNNLVSIYTNADDIDNLLKWQTVLTWLQEVSL